MRWSEIKTGIEEVKKELMQSRKEVKEELKVIRELLEARLTERPRLERWSEIKTTERPRLEQRRDGMFSKISTMVSVNTPLRKIWSVN